MPDGIDDPARPSGGNAYDRRLIDGLPALGWDVDVVVAHGGWPAPDAAARAALAAALAALPREATVLVDGLVATAAADVLVPAARRLRIVVLVHMALGVLARRRRLRPSACRPTPRASAPPRGRARRRRGRRHDERMDARASSRSTTCRLRASTSRRPASSPPRSPRARRLAARSSASRR